MICVLVLVACAVVEPPPGGPIDTIRPHLVFMIPDSASTGLGQTDELNLTFSEKMNRVSAVTWLHFFPDQRIRSTKWHGATRADIVLETPLPADTVIVVEIVAGMRDAHKVTSDRGRRFPIATGDSIPVGRISGVLVMADSAVSNGVVELYAVPPDTLQYFEQSILRRTVTDKTGAYVFDWLPVPGGPWLMRAYADANSDLRPGEKEAQRLVSDTLSLDLGTPAVTAGVTTLYPANTPGQIRLEPFRHPVFPGLTMAWTMSITDSDTGWVPATVTQANFASLDSREESLVPEVKPGNNRVIVFVDIDGDSTFSGVPDSLLGKPALMALADSADTTAAYYLEPWLMLEGVEILPGLEASATLPTLPFTLTPWTPPAAPPDSLQLQPAVNDSSGTEEKPQEKPKEKPKEKP